VLTREKNSQKDILIHSWNQALPILPLGLRITGSAEEEWAFNSALKDLTQRLGSGLEENVLRYKLQLKDRLNLEWCWQEEPCKGGMECLILAHVSIGNSTISVQNKRHLHWKVLESIMAMNNEAELSTLAHSLLQKSSAAD
jgi:hypothetical protein